VREALDAYKFNEAASELWAFVWGEFCDWYLELTKPVLYGEASPARKNAVKHALFTTMDSIIRLLHPFMPFLTEEIGSRLPGSAGFVAERPWPRAEDYPHDPAVLDEVALLQEAISAVRNLRSEIEISPKVPLRLLIADGVLRARLAPHAASLGALAGAQMEPADARPAGCATIVIRGVEVMVPLEGIVDLAGEAERLDKVLAKAEQDVAFLENKLGNAEFVAKAPAEKVDEMREKLAVALSRRDVLTSSRARIREALGWT
jgi:valyl-tRNA synthetase